MTVMELATNSAERTSEQSTEGLFFTGGNIAKHTNVLGKDVFSGTDNGDRMSREVAFAGCSVWRLVRDVVILEFTKHITNLQAFFEVLYDKMSVDLLQ